MVKQDLEAQEVQFIGGMAGCLLLLFMVVVLLCGLSVFYGFLFPFVLPPSDRQKDAWTIGYSTRPWFAGDRFKQPLMGEGMYAFLFYTDREGCGVWISPVNNVILIAGRNLNPYQFLSEERSVAWNDSSKPLAFHPSVVLDRSDSPPPPMVKDALFYVWEESGTLMLHTEQLESGLAIKLEDELVRDRAFVSRWDLLLWIDSLRVLARYRHPGASSACGD